MITRDTKRNLVEININSKLMSLHETGIRVRREGFNSDSFINYVLLVEPFLIINSQIAANFMAAPEKKLSDGCKRDVCVREVMAKHKTKPFSASPELVGAI